MWRIHILLKETKKLGEFYLVHNGNINFSQTVKDKYPELNDTKILVKK